MKILQIAPAWVHTPPKGYGGTELVIYNLVEELVNQGHEVTLFATGKSETSGKLQYVYDSSLIEMGVDWNAALPQLIHYQQAFKHAKEEGYDMVHTHLSSGTDLVIFPYLSELEIPNVTTIHGHWPYDRFSKIDDYFLKYYKQALSLINISSTMENLLPKSLKANSIGTVYNGMETSRIKFTLKQNPNGYLTWLGVIIREKGLHEAILAAKKAGEKFVFGGLVDKNRKVDSVQYFEEMVKPHIDNEQIIFLGELNFVQKVEMLNSAKAFLNPIDWEEPFGMVMIESLACGTPVISYSRGAAKEIIRDGKNGFLVSNVDEMTDAVAKIPNINRKDCRETVENQFSCTAMTEAYLNLYKKRIDMASTQEATYLEKVRAQRISKKIRQRVTSRNKVIKSFSSKISPVDYFN
jgi:glycosyltransferase involved in cell wall biosynthesis